MSVARRAIAQLLPGVRAVRRELGRQWLELDRGWKATVLSVTLLVTIIYAPI
ncbi:hypothetical protein [Halovivax limisalsi]|uniref:hypothetical protein n=1 Tax=Halovivax limisalsi TaxID=1453760 RepID=UPI001FFCD364|nr:hypothetical protein [Halovivax limisalsi]